MALSDGIQDLIEEDPDAHGWYTAWELQHGRIEWLSDHIRRQNFQISPTVAQKLLHLLERSDPNLRYELKLVRRSNLPPAKKDPWLSAREDFELAQEVARKGGFQRGQLARVCFEVGQARSPKIAGDTVRKRVRRLRKQAIQATAEERAGAGAQQSGKIGPA